MPSRRPVGAGVGRVRQRSTFEAFRSTGHRGRSGPVRIRFVPETSCSEVRFAYALGKQLGGAVVRNRLRRRLRAVVAELAPGLPPGAYLVSAGPGAPGLRFDELRTTMGYALQSATGRPVPGPAVGRGVAR